MPISHNSLNTFMFTSPITTMTRWMGLNVRRNSSMPCKCHLFERGIEQLFWLENKWHALMNIMCVSISNVSHPWFTSPSNLLHPNTFWVNLTNHTMIDELMLIEIEMLWEITSSSCSTQNTHSISIMFYQCDCHFTIIHPHSWLGWVIPCSLSLNNQTQLSESPHLQKWLSTFNTCLNPPIWWYERLLHSHRNPFLASSHTGQSLYHLNQCSLTFLPSQIPQIHHGSLHVFWQITLYHTQSYHGSLFPYFHRSITFRKHSLSLTLSPSPSHTNNAIFPFFSFPFPKQEFRFSQHCCDWVNDRFCNSPKRRGFCFSFHSFLILFLFIFSFCFSCSSCHLNHNNQRSTQGPPP